MSERSEIQFTADDIQDYWDYEEVRQGGKWNMLDPRARQATGLSGERYSFVMHNFSALKAAAEKAAKERAS